MKKVLSLLIIIPIIFSFISCDVNIEEAINNFVENSEVKIGEEAKYKIASEKYDNKGIRISYPILKNISDDNKQYKINKYIKDVALKVADLYEEVSDVNLQILYEVKYKSSKYLSIAFSGTATVPNEANPTNYFYTINLDLVNCKKLRLIDIIGLDRNLVKDIMNGSYNPINDVPNFQNVYKDMKEQDFIYSLENADSPENMGEEGYSNYYTYLANDSVGISIRTPHEFGDHMEYEINKSWLQYKLED